MLKPGYQEAHQMYNEMRNFFAHQAYATSNVELVNLKATMMWMKIIVYSDVSPLAEYL